MLLKDPNFKLRTQCQVLRINLDSDKKKATGVTYVDARRAASSSSRRKLVIVGMFALNNVRMLLLSGIGKPYDPATGKGVVGRNYAYQTTSARAACSSTRTSTSTRSCARAPAAR